MKTANLRISEEARIYKPHLSFTWETHRYLFSTAQTFLELREVLNFRTYFFLTSKGLNTKMAYDFDDFDLTYDHIIMKDKKENKIIGVCRLAPSLYCHSFYTATEFDITPLLKISANTLEIGRVCTHPSVRNTNSILYLWKAVLKYASLIGTQYIFGCININDPKGEDILTIQRALYVHGLANPEFHIVPKENYRRYLENEKYFDHFKNVTFDLRKLLPSIFYSYLRFGIKLNLEPAYDPTFNTADFFATLHVKQFKDWLRLK